MSNTFNNDTFKLAKVFKDFISNQEDTSEFIVTNNDDPSVEEGYVRYVYGTHIESDFIPFSFTTIRPIMVMFFYDEDRKIDEENFEQFQITIVLRTQWEEDEEDIGFQYFINEISDLDLYKIKLEINNYLNKFRYNNFNIIEENFDLIMNNLINQVKGE